MSLSSQVHALLDTDTGDLIRSRLAEFSSFMSKPDEAWFSELCFCLLAANAKGRTAYKIQMELGHEGLLHDSLLKVVQCIRNNNHRFHNTKAKFIVAARKHKGIKREVQGIIAKEGMFAAREWLIANIKGIGYKEASHFLRNVGYFDFAILDRHIINLMRENGIIRQRPKALTRKKYLSIEKKFLAFSKEMRMQPGELDMYMWYLTTNDVMK